MLADFGRQLLQAMLWSREWITQKWQSKQI